METSSPQRQTGDTHAWHGEDHDPSRKRKRPTTTADGSSKNRRRVAIACDTCRSRRTKCDSRKPVCSYCETKGASCVYQDTPEAPPSTRVESDLVEIKQRLDQISSLLSTAPPRPSAVRENHGNYSAAGVGSVELGVRTESPYFLLGTSSVMHAFGLDPDFAQDLLRTERAVMPTIASGGTRLFIQHQQIAGALEAYSERIHIWYPIFDTGWSDDYFRIMSGPLHPSSDTCLALLVAAIGCTVSGDGSGHSRQHRADQAFYEAALASLPIVFAACTVKSVQCVLLLGVYHCCTLNVCQAQDYSLMASFKIQNLIKARSGIDHDWEESTLRCYWAALLLENEVATQFDVAQSGIWSLDERVPLPSLSNIWRYHQYASSPLAQASPCTSSSIVSTTGMSILKVQSYCLAEIAMRRMLHRCNTAVTHRQTGSIVYAPAIALELELQLQEWYNYLPSVLRFDIEAANDPATPATLHRCPLTTFLRAQYHCCKIAIYWPAVYQAIETEEADGHLLNHCKRLFDSYVHLVPCIVAAFETCIVNRWTLFLSTFMNTMAALKAADSPVLNSVCPPGIAEFFAATTNIDREIVKESPALLVLLTTLEQRVASWSRC